MNAKTKKPRRPNNATITKVIEYLETLSLNVYGQNINVDTGKTYESLMDYSAEDVLKLIQLERRNKLWSANS